MINLFFKNKLYKISDVLNNGKTILKNKNIDTFDIDAKILLSFVSNIKHYEFISNPNKTISNKIYKKYINLIKQRAKNKPIALIIGKKEFYGLDFKVSKGTLIPRPDTETLIDAIKKEIPSTTKKLNILDMGTGSGCLLLTLLNEYKNAKGIGIDINKRAIKTARENLKNLKLENKGNILKQSWYKKSPQKLIKNNKFDIIISNPPYISKDEIKNLDPDVKNYEPHLALFSNNNGLGDYNQIAKTIKHWNILKNNGLIFLEIGKSQENDVKKIFEASGFKFLNQYKDLNGIIRVICFQNK